jgi:hypothetical protein
MNAYFTIPHLDRSATELHSLLTPEKSTARVVPKRSGEYLYLFIYYYSFISLRKLSVTASMV